MNKICLTLMLCLVTIMSYAQAPLKFNYQGIARDNNGVVSGNLSLRFTIRDQSSGGVILYQETQNTSANSFGLFNVQIGTGNITSGSMGSIQWGNGNKYLQVEIDVTGNTNYTDLGATQLISVPYAVHSNNGVAPGTVIAFAGVNVPNGWLLCDGSTVNSTQYPELYSAIGNSWGSGNGSAGSFHLPDMRGLFLRGWDGNAGNDPDKNSRTAQHNGGQAGNNVGSVQNDEIKSHTHNYSGQFTPVAAGGGSALGTSGQSTTLPFGGAESRPKNVYVKYIIKF